MYYTVLQNSTGVIAMYVAMYSGYLDHFQTHENLAQPDTILKGACRLLTLRHPTHRPS